MATRAGELTPEHAANVVIDAIQVSAETGYTVGRCGVTLIEAFTKSGLHTDIAYVRVWKGESPCAEFCQHNIVGVYFAEAK